MVGMPRKNNATRCAEGLDRRGRLGGNRSTPSSGKPQAGGELGAERSAGVGGQLGGKMGKAGALSRQTGVQVCPSGSRPGGAPCSRSPPYSPERSTANQHTRAAEGEVRSAHCFRTSAREEGLAASPPDIPDRAREKPASQHHQQVRQKDACVPQDEVPRKGWMNRTQNLCDQTVLQPTRYQWDSFLSPAVSEAPRGTPPLMAQRTRSDPLPAALA